jgi:hypothetical protein
MWFAQVSLDPARSRVSQWTLHHDQLFSLSTSGTLQTLDAETGKSLWTVRLGVPGGVFAGPAVNSEYVALMSGTKLYVLDRADGHVLWSKLVDGAAAAAPALSEKYAFVGLLSGLVEGYPLDDPGGTIWRHQSVGRIFYSPTITGEVVSWPTDRGYLYVAQASQPRVLFRVETKDEIVAPPAERDPYLFVISRDGYLYCMNELSGAEQWRISTGYPIITKPAAVADFVYVASEQPALYAVHAETGRRLWATAGATQFATLGAKQVYAMDSFGGLLILEKMSGGVIGRLAVGEAVTALVNDQSDRIFLVSDTGLVQCLRERDSQEPTYYRLKMGEAPVPPQVETDQTPAVQERPAREPTPPQAGAQPASPIQLEKQEDTEEDENPFF